MRTPREAAARPVRARREAAGTRVPARDGPPSAPRRAVRLPPSQTGATAPERSPWRRAPARAPSPHAGARPPRACQRPCKRVRAALPSSRRRPRARGCRTRATGSWLRRIRTFPARALRVVGPARRSRGYCTAQEVERWRSDVMSMTGTSATGSGIARVPLTGEPDPIRTRLPIRTPFSSSADRFTIPVTST